MCPPWCAGGHHCTAAGGGEHRSEPQVWVTGYGALIATRVQRANGADWLETRQVIRLRPDVEIARDQAKLLLLGMHLTVLDVLAGKLGRVRQAYRRLTGVRVR